MKRAFIYYTYLIITWVTAWLVFLHTPFGRLFESSENLYWIPMKFIVWVLPLIILIKYCYGESFSKYLRLVNIKKGLLTGTVLGLIFIALSAIVDCLTKSFHLPTINFSFFGAVIFAPLFEEIVFRGFILKNIYDKNKVFWQANLITALMFLGIHIPGWYFQERLFILKSITSAFTVFIVGLIAGYAKKKSDSLWGSILFHAINNLYSLFFF
jgi:membrane protease YdiL (CAAX protease family)